MDKYSKTICPKQLKPMVQSLLNATCSIQLYRTRPNKLKSEQVADPCLEDSKCLILQEPEDRMAMEDWQYAEAYELSIEAKATSSDEAYLDLL